MKKIITILTLIIVTYNYSQNKKLDRIINSNYNQTTNVWEEISKVEFTYNSNSKITNEIYYDKDGSGNWGIYWEVYYTYDVNNNLIELIENQENWLNHKEINTYDANNFLFQKIINKTIF